MSFFARPIRQIPVYSEAARKTKYQGACFLRVTVGTDGLPYDIKVVRALGMGLDKSAVETVAPRRFQPAIRDGEPVSTEATVQVNFHLY